MSEATAIAWCDSTFNPWIGCTKVGPGCDHCYAEALMDTRHKRVQWGAGQSRSRTSADNWKAPVSWNKHLFYECLGCGARFAPERRKEGFLTCPNCSPHKGRKVDSEDDASSVKIVRRRVFCASLADVFDNEVDPAWRRDLFDLIRATPNLDWLLLTKRIGNVAKMLPWVSEGAPGNMVAGGMVWPNVWLGATVVNQEEADRDIPKLLEVSARVRFLSIEPLLGPIDVSRWLGPARQARGMFDGIDWVIVGGESQAGARPMHPDWARSLRDQCAAVGVPMLFKQWGEWAPTGPVEGPDIVVAHDGRTCELDSQAMADLARVGPITPATRMYRVGKKAAGRILDGIEHNGFPGAHMSHDHDSWVESVQRQADLLRGAIASNEMRLSAIAVAESMRRIHEALELVGVKETA